MDKKNPKSKIQNPKTRKSKAAKRAQQAGPLQDAGKKRAATKSDPQTMEELLAAQDYKVPTFTLGEYIEGKLISVHPKEVLVDIGGKAYAVVGHKELPDIQDVFTDFKVGDKVVGRVISEENREGRVVVSLRKFAYDNRWGKLQAAHKEGEKVEVIVRDIVNGGALVDFAGVRGYIPPGHIDPDYRDNPNKLRGRAIEVKVLEIGREQNRLVVSQKLVTRKDEIAEKNKLLKKIKPGEVFEAEIEGVVPFGLFVRIPTDKKVDGEPLFLEGLVHISEIAWEKVEEPSEHYAEGDKVKVAVLEKDDKETKLNLSIKQTVDDPWAKVEEKYKVGEMVKGKVVRESAYGIFVELEKGVEGLAHISNIPAGVDLKVGDKVTAQIDAIELAERRIALSIIPTEKPVAYR